MELTAIINKINSFLWGVPLLILLLGGGVSEHKAWISTDTHFKNNEENGFYAV